MNSASECLEEIGKEYILGRYAKDLEEEDVYEISVTVMVLQKKNIFHFIQHFLKQYNKKYGFYKELSVGALNALCRYHWPGSVRELGEIGGSDTKGKDRC